MNLLRKDKLISEIKSMTGELIQIHFDVAARYVEYYSEPNITLWHLSAVMKIALRLLCMRHKIVFTNCDSIEILFDKTYNLLTIEILDVEKDICYWHNDLPYETKNAMTVDEAMDIGRKIQTFYNDIVVPAVSELLSVLEEAEESASSTVSTIALGHF